MSHISAFYRCPKCRSRRSIHRDGHIYKCLDCGTFRFKGGEVVQVMGIDGKGRPALKWVTKKYNKDTK